MKGNCMARGSTSRLEFAMRIHMNQGFGTQQEISGQDGHKSLSEDQ